MRSSFLIALVATLLCMVCAQTPIPARPDGFSVGSATAPVVIDGFFDLVCPDCRAEWPTIKQMLSLYGPTSVRFVMHTFPLPYHQMAFIANQGVHVVAAQDKSLVWQYADLLFSPKQDSFSTAATANMSASQVIDALSTLVDSANIMPAAAFKAGLKNGTLNSDTRVSWKYSASRAVVGTPTFHINGVYVSADSSWTLKDWQSVIDPLLKSNGIAPPARATRATTLRKSSIASLFDKTCPPGQPECDYTPGKSECCLPGESCIPNVGCRCLDAAQC